MPKHTNPAAHPLARSTTLNLVNPQESKMGTPIQTSWKLQQNNLLVEFYVNAPVLYKKDIYQAQDFPYMYDVAEVFIAVNDPKSDQITYYEYEITPLNQVYNLRLDVLNGKRHATDLPNIDAHAKVEASRWSASFNIPLDQIGWNGDVRFLRGNFYAILGNNPRTYWSAFLPQQQIADFHKPEFFKPLF